MGILDRIGKSLASGVTAGKETAGLISDLATAPWNDREEGGMGEVVGIFKKRGAPILENAFGPQGLIGAPIGGLPEWMRAPVRETFKGLDIVYREAVSRPASTLLMTASLAASPGGGGKIIGMRRADNWREAYRMSKNISPGQSLAYGLMLDDVTDQQQLAAVAGTDTFHYISGTADAFSRIFLDPTVIGGKTLTAARSGQVARKVDDAGNVTKTPTWVGNKIETKEDRSRFIGSTRYLKFQEATLGKSAPEIRDTYLKGHEQGAVIATLLADARNADEHRHVTLALMGDMDAKNMLREENIALNNALERAHGRRDVLEDKQGTLFEELNTPEELKSLNDEIDQLYGQVAARDFITSQGADESLKQLREVPSYSKFAAAKQAFVTSATEAPDGAGRLRETLYQKNPFSMVLRKATTWAPGGAAGVVSLHDPASDAQLARFLKKSRLDETESQALRDEYMRAGDEFSRQLIWHKTEQQAIARIAEQKGLTEEAVNELVGIARQGRKRVDDLANVKGRVYDGEGNSRIRFQDDETGHMVDIPLLVTQNANVHFVRDLDEVEQAVSRIGAYINRHPHVKSIKDVPVQFMDAYQRVWKPATLLRLGWPIRVVMDEQLRIMSKVGALSQFVTALGAGARGSYEYLRKVDQDLRVPGERKFKYGDYQLPSAFGGMPGDSRNMYVALNRARGSFDSLYGRSEREYLMKLRGENVPGGMSSKQWTSIRADESPESYASAWEHAVNKQIGQDLMARQFLEGKTVDEVADWLRKTPEGRSYAKRNRLRANRPQQWAADVEDQVRRYTAEDPAIMAAALGGRARHDDLAKLIQDPAHRPVVHGELLEQSMGRGISGMWNNIVETGYRKLGETPSSTLSRNPFFDHVYRDEMKRLIDLDDRPTLTQADLDKMAHASRQYALAETKKLLYDLGERSDLEQALRFFVPFYGAWGEVLTRWAGIANQNPAYVARIKQIWNSPERAGIVTDENGAQIFEDGSALSADGEVTEAGNDRYLNVAVPEWAKDLPVVGKGLETKGDMAFNKKSMNLVLQGPPGIGPLGQIPINEIVKDHPQLEDSFKWALPFGTTQDMTDIILPAGMKRAKQDMEGEDNRTYVNQMMRIYYDKVVDYNLGLRKEPPTYEEAKKEADALAKLRTASAYLMPFQATYKSPYQPYIDSLRAARQRLGDDPFALGVHEDGSPYSADEWFYETYGPEFFALSQSMSKSLDGVPPTLNGVLQRGVHKDLIEKHPDLGGLIIGAEGAGEFMGSVYDAQFKNKLRPGSDLPQRDAPSFEESTASFEARQGWLEYGKFMDLIDAELEDRELPNLKVKAAADLKKLRDDYVTAHKQQYPGWKEAYESNDSGAVADRLTALREIAGTEKLQGRDDINGLSQYLALRDMIVVELDKRRGSKQGAQLERNPDIEQLWESLKSDLVRGNLAFSSLYYRYLENDVPTPNPGGPTQRSALLKTGGS